MTMSYACDAVVVGSGPNGLAAAITLARAGCSVLVCEANTTIGGTAACLYQDVDLTAEQLPGDSRAYRRLMKPLACNWEKLANEFLQPMLHLPRHPLALARFGIPALCPASLLAKTLFKHEPARALFGGI